MNQRCSYYFKHFLFFFITPKGAVFVLLIHLGYKTLTEIVEVSGDFFSHYVNKRVQLIMLKLKVYPFCIS